MWSTPRKYGGKTDGPTFSIHGATIRPHELFWAKPLLSFEYAVDSLPEDRILMENLRFLANTVNGALAIT